MILGLLFTKCSFSIASALFASSGFSKITLASFFVFVSMNWMTSWIEFSSSESSKKRDLLLKKTSPSASPLSFWVSRGLNCCLVFHSPYLPVYVAQGFIDKVQNHSLKRAVCRHTLWKCLSQDVGHLFHLLLWLSVSLWDCLLDSGGCEVVYSCQEVVSLDL